MSSENRPCRNPALCGVKNHRPGTQAACERQGGQVTKSYTDNLLNTPAPTTGLKVNPKLVFNRDYDDDASWENEKPGVSPASSILQESDEDVTETYLRLQDQGYGNDTRMGKPEFTNELADSNGLDRDLVSAASVHILKDMLSGITEPAPQKPRSTAEFLATTDQTTKQLYGHMYTQGHFDYADPDNDKWVEDYAKRTTGTIEQVKDAAQQVKIEREKEQEDILQRHNERAERYIKETPKDPSSLKRHQYVVVDDGTEAGRIVYLTSVKVAKDKFYGYTADEYGNEHIDGWDLSKIRTS